MSKDKKKKSLKIITENAQPIEKRVNDETQLDVISVWYTIQGEGPYSGVPSVFVRLAGCNLQCERCDTDYTSKRQTFEIPEIIRRIENIIDLYPNTRLVVITGGEPFRQNITGLVSSLILKLKIDVQIETNGTLFTEDDATFWKATKAICEKSSESLTIVCSPKTAKISPNIIPFVDFYKYVVEADKYNEMYGTPTSVLGSDNVELFAPTDLKELADQGRVYIQPFYTNKEKSNKANTDTAIKIASKFGYNLSIQIHKIIGVE